MIMKRIYDPEIGEQAAKFPRLNTADAVATRNAVKENLRKLAEKGFVRPTDNRIKEIEISIPVPDMGIEIPMRIYMAGDRSNVSPYASPARAEDLSNLPPAYIMTCEHDPLRDEAIIYAMRLMNAGVPVELHNYPGTVHGFDYLTPSNISTNAINESIEAFKRVMKYTQGY